MTTTVYDKNVKLITSDSRWSADINDSEVLYIDTAEFEKMVEQQHFALVMAGDASLISGWKEWAKGDIEKDIPNVTRVEQDGSTSHISVCVIFKPSTVLFDSDVATDVTPHARFSGSGRFFAKDCWNQNQCAKKAVESAINSDVYTGGAVKYVDLSTQDNNLSDDTTTLKELETLMCNEGYIMNIKTKEITDMENYTNKEDIAQDMQDGKIVASAPTGSDESPWNESQESALGEAVNVLRALITNRD